MEALKVIVAEEDEDVEVVAVKEEEVVTLALNPGSHIHRSQPPCAYPHPPIPLLPFLRALLEPLSRIVFGLALFFQ